MNVDRKFSQTQPQAMTPRSGSQIIPQERLGGIEEHEEEDDP